ncbi:glycosyltransferase family 2 protein [Pseudodesulfovibrio indicus]|nr:glycosyltransferase family 2 protein [Pseudodesulfovibrio indicus]
MHGKVKPAVIIPVLDEVSTVREVVRGVLGHGCDAIVVDDSSSDGSGRAAREAGAEVLTMPFGCGAWNATLAGLLHAVKRGGYPGFLTMDGDGQHDPDCIPALLAHGASTGADVVVGSCPQRGGPARQWAWNLFSSMTRLPVRDFTSGLRLYSPRAVRCVLTPEAALYDYQDLGVLLLLHRRGLSLAELPVDMRPRQSGRSRVFSNRRDVAAYLVKTGLGVLSHWLAAPAPVADWRDYDAG